MVAAARSSSSSAPKALHVSLWIVQGLLALAFLGAGILKMTTPLDELAKQMAWVGNLGGVTRFIGAAEFAGALGLILPSLTRVLPVLTLLAGAALALVMTLAIGYHVTHGEAALIAPNIVLGGLAAFVAWGRFKAAPIASRR